MSSLSLASIPITSPLARRIPIALALSLVPSVMTRVSIQSFGKDCFSIEARSSANFGSASDLAGITRESLNLLNQDQHKSRP